MTDSELTDTWAVLQPTPQQRRRIEARVLGWLEARESPLAAEWLRLFKANPFARLSIAAIAACLVLFATPLSWLAFSAL
jgi:hypothetical protein